MEEQIKALIEKYEGKAENVPDQIITAGSDYMKGYVDGVKFGTNSLLDDLKQLLTTSQGNPERMV